MKASPECEKLNISSLLDAFLDQLGGRKSARTRELYVERLTLFIDLFGDLHPQDLNGGHVTKWLDILEERSYAPATMTGFRQALKAFLNACVRMGAIERSPAQNLKVGTTISKRRRLPDSAELAKAHALAYKWMLTSDKPRKIRDGMIFCLCCCCGPRSKELRRLRLSEVKYALRQGPDSVGVYKAVSGGKTDETVIRFTEDEAQGFRRWLDFRPNATIDICFVPMKKSRTKRDPTLCWRKFSRSGLDTIFVNLCKTAGVSPIRSHPIRHYIGTKLAREKHPAKVIGSILNHADASTTAATAIAYYIHVEDEDISSAIATTASPSNPHEILPETAEMTELNKLFNNRPSK